MLRIQISYDGDATSWTINERKVTPKELDHLLVRLGQIDTNQFLYIIAASNVPASDLVATIGIVQRAGLHDIGLICRGYDGTNSGIWQITIDALPKGLPTCLGGDRSDSGFQKDWQSTLTELLPLVEEIKEQPTRQ